MNVTHSLAVDLLKQADGAVTLTAVSWPGTIVWKSLTLSVHHGLGQLWNDLLSPLCQNKQLSGQQPLLKNLQTYSSRKSQSLVKDATTAQEYVYAICFLDKNRYENILMVIIQGRYYFVHKLILWYLLEHVSWTLLDAEACVSDMILYIQWLYGCILLIITVNAL